MFQLYTGNRLEDLAVLLAKILGSFSPPENPFDDWVYLVQNPGMRFRWLKMFLHQSHSIAAAFGFSSSLDVCLANLFQQTLDEYSGAQSWVQ